MPPIQMPNSFDENKIKSNYYLSKDGIYDEQFLSKIKQSSKRFNEKNLLTNYYLSNDGIFDEQFISKIKPMPKRFNEKKLKANYYLSKDGIFDEQFLSIIQHGLNKMNYNQSRIIIPKLFDHSNFPVVAFSMSEMGPKVVYRDFNSLPRPNKLEEDLYSFLQNLGISFMVGLARGHTYNEGVFEMPSNIPNYRVMVICFSCKKWNDKNDKLLSNGYIQIGIFIPRDILEYLPSFSSFEDSILNLVKSQLNDYPISTERISSIKSSVLNFIQELVLKKLPRNSLDNNID